jgi:hypothetical protein
VSGSLVADLGIGPETWLFLSLVGCVMLFFKFSRVWSVRNLDLLLLFVLAPGLMSLVGHGGTASQQPWISFVLLFAGSACWLVRCVVDLGLTRRPLLEPNLNAAGLACLLIAILTLLIAETVSLTVNEGVQRNPANAGSAREGAQSGSKAGEATVEVVLKHAPLPGLLRAKPPRVILSRVLASLAHIGMVCALIATGWWHFNRPITGLAMATCYLIMPYTRIALVDSGQLVPAALVVTAVAFYNRPALAGGLIGVASGWMPACLGLIPLWAGFYRGRGTIRFLAAAVPIIAVCGGLGWYFPELAAFARDLGARSLTEAGLVPNAAPPASGSFWTGLDVSYRLPVIIAYIALVMITTIWPAEKNLGELVALSAAQLVASQFWYLADGGTLVLLYLPLVLQMMFRPNLAAKRALVLEPRAGSRRRAA